MLTKFLSMLMHGLLQRPVAKVGLRAQIRWQLASFCVRCVSGGETTSFLKAMSPRLELVTPGVTHLFHSRTQSFSRWIGSVFIGVAGVLYSAGACAADLEIRSFPSAIGTVTHFEIPKGEGYLLVRQTGKRLLLPFSWRQSNVEQVFQLGQQTAVVLSHSDNRCASGLSLIVLTPSKIWGAYNLGGCDEVMAYQQSADGNELVAVRVDAGSPLAWTYSATEQAFRGPVGVLLPVSLQSFIGAPVSVNPPSPPVVRDLPAYVPPELPTARAPQSQEPAFGGHQAPSRPLYFPTAKPSTEPTRPSAPKATFPSAADPKAPAFKAPEVWVEPNKPQSQPARPIVASVPQPAAKPAMPAISRNADVTVSPPSKPTLVQQSGMTRDDASQVANQVKKSAKPQPRVNLDLT